MNLNYCESKSDEKLQCICESRFSPTHRQTVGHIRKIRKGLTSSNLTNTTGLLSQGLLLPGKQITHGTGGRRVRQDTAPRGREDLYNTGKNVNDHLHAFNRVNSKRQKHTHLACYKSYCALKSKIMCQQKADERKD